MSYHDNTLYPLHLLDIAKIEQLEQYALVRTDRRVMFHNIKSSVEPFAEFICDMGENCLGLKFGNEPNRFQYLIINLDFSTKIILFSISEYFLGILLENHPDPMDIVKEVSHFIRRTLHSKTNQ